MALTTLHPNHYHFMMGTKEIDYENDTFIIILIAGTSFTFDIDSHATLDDFLVDELSFYTKAERSTAYTTETRIPDTPNGHYYTCTTGGTTAGTEPTWNTGAGSTTTDGTAVWTEQGADTLNGYTTGKNGGQSLDNVVVTEDDTNNQLLVEWDPEVFTANGADWNNVLGCAVIDTTTGDDTCIFYTDFDASYDIPDGSSFQVQTIKIKQYNKP